jgi:uncharacterized protein (TIGR02145 family)
MKRNFLFVAFFLLIIVLGLQISLTGCKRVTLPTLTTIDASNLSTTSASSGGNITDDGNADVTARGVCYGTETQPAITGSKTSEGTGTGSFTSSLTSLTPNTMYYVRAYATNSEGTAYGIEVTFTTNPIVGATVTTATPSTITATSAVSGGDVSADGGATVTEKGICWATTANPTTANNKVAATGTGTGTFTANLTGLQPGTVYHVRAYAINSSGTSYGSDLSFTTLSVKPTVSTAAVTVFAQTTATAGGDVTATGGANVTEKGVCYGTAINPTTSTGTKVVATTTGLGAFTCSLTGLTAGTLYHVRAYAINSVDTEYGADVTFTTSPVLAATVTTAIPSTITATTAILGGEVTSSGGGTISARGVCYGTSPNPALPAASHTTLTGGVGTFSSTVAGLSDGTVYYVRAYATNGAGTSYGNQLEFTTNHETGTLTDVDGNVYKTVKIGNQWWMAENLKTIHYNDDTPITLETDDGVWSTLTSAAYCWYFNDPGTYKDISGAIYNWFAGNTGKLCPTGWSIPSDEDYKALEMFLGMTQAQADGAYWRGTDQGSKMKTTTGWSLGGNGTNSSGFSAFPGGYRYWLDGVFYGQGTIGSWMTSTEYAGSTVIYRNLESTYTSVWRNSINKNAGKSVRCLKD